MISPSFYGFKEDDEEFQDTILGKMSVRLRRLEAEGDRMRLDMVSFKKQLSEMQGQDEQIKELKEELEGLKAERLIKEEENKELKREMEWMKKVNNQNKKALDELKSENEALKKRCDKDESCVKEKVQSIVKDEVKIWNKEVEKEKASFREVLLEQQKEQQKEQDAKIEKKVVGVIKTRSELVRDTVDKKKCLVMFGVQEIKKSSKLLREREEVKKAKDIIASLNNEEENEKYEDEVDEVRRLGRYVQGGARPIKIRFKSQVAAEELVCRAGRFSKSEAYKNVWLKRDLDEEERNKMKELNQCAKVKNEERSEEEKKEFFWRVLDMRVIKWYLKK